MLLHTRLYWGPAKYALQQLASQLKCRISAQLRNGEPDAAGAVHRCQLMFNRTSNARVRRAAISLLPRDHVRGQHVNMRKEWSGQQR